MTATTLAAPAVSTALLTDHYELTMLRAALADGTADHRAVFEVFARRLPAGRRYGVFAGLGRLLNAIENFTFTPTQLDALITAGVIDEPTRAWLADFSFTGSIDAYREGELFFPYSPVLTVEASFGEAVLLETLILSVLNHDSAIASAAARMVTAARGRTLIEMGSRRTSETAAVAAARAAYIAGFDATSNLEAAVRYGVPSVGTSAHAFTLAHESEKAAFAAQVAALGASTTLLVDTYDIEAGIRTAVEVAGPDLGGIRIDSGDLGVEAAKARVLLDSLGATKTKIVLTGDLDERSIDGLAATPVDVFGVGTKLVTGSGAPTAEMVYKLVAVADTPGSAAPLRPVAKRSAGKVSVGGRKRAYRALDDNGHAAGERIVVRFTDGYTDAGLGRPLQTPVVRDGSVVHTPDLAEIRAHHRGAKAELLPLDLDVAPGAPRLTATR